MAAFHGGQWRGSERPAKRAQSAPARGGRSSGRGGGQSSGRGQSMNHREHQHQHQQGLVFGKTGEEQQQHWRFGQGGRQQEQEDWRFEQCYRQQHQEESRFEEGDEQRQQEDWKFEQDDGQHQPQPHQEDWRFEQGGGQRHQEDWTFEQGSEQRRQEDCRFEQDRREQHQEDSRFEEGGEQHRQGTWRFEQGSEQHQRHNEECRFERGGHQQYQESLIFEQGGRKQEQEDWRFEQDDRQQHQEDWTFKHDGEQQEQEGCRFEQGSGQQQRHQEFLIFEQGSREQHQEFLRFEQDGGQHQRHQEDRRFEQGDRQQHQEFLIFEQGGRQQEQEDWRFEQGGKQRGQGGCRFEQASGKHQWHQEDCRFDQGGRQQHQEFLIFEQGDRQQHQEDWTFEHGGEQHIQEGCRFQQGRGQQQRHQEDGRFERGGWQQHQEFLRFEQGGVQHGQKDWIFEQGSEQHQRHQEDCRFEQGGERQQQNWRFEQGGGQHGQEGCIFEKRSGHQQQQARMAGQSRSVARVSRRCGNGRLAIVGTRTHGAGVVAPTTGGAGYGGGASPHGEMDFRGKGDAGTVAMAPEEVTDGSSRDGGSGILQADKPIWICAKCGRRNWFERKHTCLHCGEWRDPERRKKKVRGKAGKDRALKQAPAEEPHCARALEEELELSFSTSSDVVATPTPVTRSVSPMPERAHALVSASDAVISSKPTDGRLETSFPAEGSSGTVNAAGEDGVLANARSDNTLPNAPVFDAPAVNIHLARVSIIISRGNDSGNGDEKRQVAVGRNGIDVSPARSVEGVESVGEGGMVFPEREALGREAVTANDTVNAAEEEVVAGAVNATGVYELVVNTRAAGTLPDAPALGSSAGDGQRLRIRCDSSGSSTSTSSGSNSTSTGGSSSSDVEENKGVLEAGGDRSPARPELEVYGDSEGGIVFAMGEAMGGRAMADIIHIDKATGEVGAGAVNAVGANEVAVNARSVDTLRNAPALDAPVGDGQRSRARCDSSGSSSTSDSKGGESEEELEAGAVRSSAHPQARVGGDAEEEKESPWEGNMDPAHLDEAVEGLAEREAGDDAGIVEFEEPVADGLPLEEEEEAVRWQEVPAGGIANPQQEENEVDMEPPVVRGGRWWGRKISQAAVVAGFGVCSRLVTQDARASGFRGSQLNVGDVLGVGEHLASRGTLPWSGRVSVTQGGGLLVSRKLAGIVTYDKLSIAEDVSEGQRYDGFLCNVERVGRKMMGQGELIYGLTIDNGQLVLGSGRFCRVFATPISRSIADRIGVGERGSDIRNAHGVFNNAGDFQLVTHRGEVLWSTAQATGKDGEVGVWWWSGEKVDGGTNMPKDDERGEGAGAVWRTAVVG